MNASDELLEFSAAVARELNRQRRNGELISEESVVMAVDRVISDPAVSWMYERETTESEERQENR